MCLVGEVRESEILGHPEDETQYARSVTSGSEKRQSEAFPKAHIALNAVIDALSEIDSPYIQKRILRAAAAYWDLSNWIDEIDKGGT